MDAWSHIHTARGRAAGVGSYLRSQHGSAAGCDPRQRSLRGGDPRESVQLTDREELRDDLTMKKKQAVEEIERQVEMLRSSVEEHRATAAKLTKEITEQEENTSKWYDGVRTTNEVRQYNGYEWHNRYNDAR